MSINRTSYSGGPQEVTMAVGVKGKTPPKPKNSPVPPPPQEEKVDLSQLRGTLNVAGARFYKPSTTPTPGHRWNLQQLRAGEAIVPSQYGSNNFETQKGGDLKIGNWTVSELRKGQGIIISQAGSNQFESQKGGDLKIGKFTVSELRKGQGIIISQAGSNKFESQKGMTGFGTPRNTKTRQVSSNPNLIPAEADLPDEPEAKIGNWTVAELRKGQGIIISQSGSNQFASQKGSSGFGARRDVKGKHLKWIWELEYPEAVLIE